MKVTIEMIAEKAQVSRGTVDRVIHNRGRVKPETIEKIQNIMRELHYTPDPLGRAFALSQQKIKIGVLASFPEADFSEQIFSGIRDGTAYAEQYGLHVLVKNIDYEDTNACERVIDEFREEGVRGIALKGISQDAICRKLKAMRNLGVKVITFNTDMRKDSRDCYVGQNHVQSGQCAAFLMHQICKKKGETLLVGFSREHRASCDRLRSFSDTYIQLGSEHRVSLPQYCHGQRHLAYEITKRYLLSHSDVAGIFVGASGLSGVCEAVLELGVREEVKVIGFDITRTNLGYLQNGAVQFLIGQNPYYQGYQPLCILTDSLFLNKPIETKYYDTGIDIKTPYNL